MTKSKTKVYLDVPFTEKDEAKACGAWWDPERKSWFVPIGKDVEDFRKWLKDEREEEDEAA